ncbi:Uncharacterised protein [Neisseria meningitidis]|nr:Uncharacterised protein [Neisseria meningitidis]
MVGRFVKQEQIGAANQGLRKIQAHTPAAGKGFDGAAVFFLRKTQPVQQFCRAGRRGISVDFFQFGMIFRLLHAVILRFRLPQCRLKSLQLGIALQNVIQSGNIQIGRFLGNGSEPPVFRNRDIAAVLSDFTLD